MIKTLLLKPLTYAALSGLIIPTLAHTQSASWTPAQQYSKDLYKKALSGQDGAFEVSYALASCHGFQSALYSHLTKDVEIAIRDIQMNETIAKDSQRAGYAAALIIFNYKAKPDQHVNIISQSVRQQWNIKFQDMDDRIDDAVWEKLLACKQLAPLSDYLFNRALDEATIQ